MSVGGTYMSVGKCLFVTLYKSVSYKAFFSHYIFLDSFFLKKKLDRKKNKKKGFGPFLIFFLKTTSPKRNDISPDLIPGDRQQQSSKRGSQGKRPGRGVEYRPGTRRPGRAGRQGPSERPGNRHGNRIFHPLKTRKPILKRFDALLSRGW